MVELVMVKMNSASIKLILLEDAVRPLFATGHIALT